MEVTQMNVRLDRSVKRAGDAVLEACGCTPSTTTLRTICCLGRPIARTSITWLPMTRGLYAAPRCPALTWRVPWSSSSRVGLLVVAGGSLVQSQVHVREDGAKQCGTRGGYSRPVLPPELSVSLSTRAACPRSRRRRPPRPPRGRSCARRHRRADATSQSRPCRPHRGSSRPPAC